jgi:hypothetical protein
VVDFFDCKRFLDRQTQKKKRCAFATVIGFCHRSDASRSADPDRSCVPARYRCAPTTSTIGIAARNSASSDSGRYCASVERELVAAFELDAEREIVASRPPRQSETPACQARREQETNWISSPSRRIEEVGGDPQSLDLANNRDARPGRGNW